MLPRRMLLLCLALFLVCSVAASLAAAAAQFKDLKAEEVKRLIDKKGKALIVDARTREEFAQGRIPGAVNLPPEAISMIDKLLPKDKQTTLVFYCRGIG